MDRQKAKRYRWTNVVVLIVSVYLLASAQWGTTTLVEEGTRRTVLDAGWLSMAYTLAGLAGLSAVFVSPRWPVLGRILTGVGGLLVLSGFLALGRVTLVPVLSIGLSGVVLLVAAALMGPMPTPEQEGKPRSSPGA